MRQKQKKRKRAKRILAWVLAVLTLIHFLPSLPAEVMAAPISGIWDGTTMTMPEIDSEGVYRIRTGAELAWFAAEVNRGNGEINARLENIFI